MLVHICLASGKLGGENQKASEDYGYICVHRNNTKNAVYSIIDNK